jgi:hypothetical protein
MNELHESKFFSKLDLTTEYHQVRMCLKDVEKTTFKTHHRHYKFKMMPFNLINAPANFRALMNNILEPCLKRFMVVFFDGILIYNSILELHISHLRNVLEILRDN